MARRIRVSVRNDGAVLTWTMALEKNPNFRTGWKIIEDDGSEKIVMDKVSETIMDKTPSSKREEMLIEENARLKELLYNAGISQEVIEKPVIVKKPDLQPGESKLPGIATETLKDVPDDIPILPGPTSDMTEDPIEESIQLEPGEVPIVDSMTGVEHITKSALSRMKKEELIVHAHALNPGVDLPDGANKPELIAEILKIQEASK